MKVGDLVRIKEAIVPGKFYFITRVLGVGGLVCLCSFPSNQVFSEDQLEVVSESG